VQPRTRSQPTLLLADGHVSHTNNLRLIEKARENVTLLIFPSHYTHKLQPLDVAVFKSLKWNYDNEVMTWLRAHPGRAVCECDIAYGKAATVANAASGFEKTGIIPFNSELFSDDDFLASAVTDVDQLTRVPSALVTGEQHLEAPASQPSVIPIEPSQHVLEPLILTTADLVPNDVHLPSTSNQLINEGLSSISGPLATGSTTVEQSSIATASELVTLPIKFVPTSFSDLLPTPSIRA
jgi:hypothetical protein